MRFGFVLPGGTATQQLELAVAAEAAGWDGVFVWEASYAVDPWSLLAAMSQRTERVRLGTMLTPLPFRRPWKVASQAATLDALSGGRAVLAVGLGAVDPELGTAGEDTDLRTRADRLDEGIDLIAGLWAGRLAFEGKHYKVDFSAASSVAAHVTGAKVPIWVVGAWPRPKSMRRVLRCDGILPTTVAEDGTRLPTVDELRELVGWLRDRGGMGPGFDVVMEGETPSDDGAKAAEIVGSWRDAGATWWLETRWQVPPGVNAREEVMTRIQAGPPPLG